ncbi:MAG: Uma2 family endonuclease [Candidatus Bipolaricaulia bacterium]
MTRIGPLKYQGMERLAAPAKRLSYEEFLAWCDEDTWAEWIDGRVILLSPASRRHQELFGFLANLLSIYVQSHDLGTLLTAPFQMYLAALRRGREPDLLFVTKGRLHLLKETHLDGPADLVVEISSSESRLRDRGERFAEYELAGVREYWLIDPEERRADFYRLAEDGRYRLIELELGGIYRSRVLSGFWLKLEWLWQEPLPSVLKVLRELRLI